MNNIIIADAGSSKTSWISCHSGSIKSFITPGFNPAIHNKTDFLFPPELLNFQIEGIYYYGTGILDDHTKNIVHSILHTHLPNAEIFLFDDLIAAARGTLGKKAGGIGILGTGSNSAFYDGHKLLKKIPALGYILGDEGGGVDIGKKILKSYFYDRIPTDEKKVFETQYNLTKSAVLYQLKSNPYPNRYLADFASFLSKIEGNWKKNLLLESFSNFFELRKNDFSQTDSNCFVGSIAYAYKDTLIEAGKNFNIEISKIEKTPIQGLVKYHIEKNYE